MGRASHVEDDGLLHFKEAYESCKKDEDQPLTCAKKSPPGGGSRAAAGRLLPPGQPERQLRYSRVKEVWHRQAEVSQRTCPPALAEHNGR